MKHRPYRIDLSRQMADCDANFIRLLKLMPALEPFRIKYLQSSHEGCASLRDEAVAASWGMGTLPESCEREFLISSPSEPQSEARVRISVLEVFAYTSTLSVTQVNRVSEWVEPPSILVRMYHDAATAEAVAYQGHRAFLARYALPNPAMYHQDEKRQINEFLGEWLRLCLQAGRSVNTPEFFCAA
jgi:uncharacterized protein YqiB (DUF1249 family)